MWSAFLLSMSLISLTLAFPHPSNDDFNDLLDLDPIPSNDGDNAGAPPDSNGQGDALAFAGTGSNTRGSGSGSSQSTDSGHAVAPVDGVAQKWNPMAPLLRELHVPLLPYQSVCEHRCEVAIKFIINKFGKQIPPKAGNSQGSCKERSRQVFESIVWIKIPGMEWDDYDACETATEVFLWFLLYGVCVDDGFSDASCWKVATFFTGCWPTSRPQPQFSKCLPSGHWPPKGIQFGPDQKPILP